MSTKRAEAYSFCESVTRSRAANFYYGIRLLDGEKRRAMCAVYAFARRVDDIGDGGLERDEKRRLLEQTQSALAALDASAYEPGGEPDPVIVALRDARLRFAFAPEALAELIEGVRMDVEGVRYEHFEELVLYCRRVAGAVGRISLAIFGVRSGEPAEAEPLADDLGVALQLTNILRDLREDAQSGRVYVPGEDLRRFGLNGTHGGSAIAMLMAGSRGPGAGDGGAEAREHDRARLRELVRFEADRAEGWYERGMLLAPMLDRRSAACVRAMAGIYHRLLQRIARRPELVLRERVSLGPHEKAWVAARSMLGAPT
jgi:phytoene synthase